jgi:hypothetical protein
MVTELGQFFRAYDEDWYRQHVTSPERVAPGAASARGRL